MYSSGDSSTRKVYARQETELCMRKTRRKVERQRGEGTETDVDCGNRCQIKMNTPRPQHPFPHILAARVCRVFVGGFRRTFRTWKRQKIVHVTFFVIFSLSSFLFVVITNLQHSNPNTIQSDLSISLTYSIYTYIYICWFRSSLSPSR